MRSKAIVYACTVMLGLERASSGGVSNTQRLCSICWCLHAQYSFLTPIVKAQDTLVCWYSRAYIRTLARDEELPVPSPTYLLQNTYDETEGAPHCLLLYELLCHPGQSEHRLRSLTILPLLICIIRYWIMQSNAHAAGLTAQTHAAHPRRCLYVSRRSEIRVLAI